MQALLSSMVFAIVAMSSMVFAFAVGDILEAKLEVSLNGFLPGLGVAHLTTDNTGQNTLPLCDGADVSLLTDLCHVQGFSSFHTASPFVGTTELGLTDVTCEDNICTSRIASCHLQYLECSESLITRGKNFIKCGCDDLVCQPLDATTDAEGRNIVAACCNHGVWQHTSSSHIPMDFATAQSYCSDLDLQVCTSEEHTSDDSTVSFWTKSTCACSEGFDVWSQSQHSPMLIPPSKGEIGDRGNEVVGNCGRCEAICNSIRSCLLFYCEPKGTFFTCKLAADRADLIESEFASVNHLACFKQECPEEFSNAHDKTYRGSSLEGDEIVGKCSDGTFGPTRICHSGEYVEQIGICRTEKAVVIFSSTLPVATDDNAQVEVLIENVLDFEPEELAVYLEIASHWCPALNISMQAPDGHVELIYEAKCRLEDLYTFYDGKIAQNNPHEECFVTAIGGDATLGGAPIGNLNNLMSNIIGVYKLLVQDTDDYSDLGLIKKAALAFAYRSGYSDDCGKAMPGTYNGANDLCEFCNCHVENSLNQLCTHSGHCYCKVNFMGKKCEIEIEYSEDSTYTAVHATNPALTECAVATLKGPAQARRTYAGFNVFGYECCNMHGVRSRPDCETLFADDTVFEGLSFNSATQICANNNLRLCSKEEITTSGHSNLGCDDQMGNLLSWSRSQCDCGAGYYPAAGGTFSTEGDTALDIYGGGQVVASCEQCRLHCSQIFACRSFHCREVTRQCYLFDTQNPATISPVTYSDCRTEIDFSPLSCVKTVCEVTEELEQAHGFHCPFSTFGHASHMECACNQNGLLIQISCSNGVIVGQSQACLSADTFSTSSHLDTISSIHYNGSPTRTFLFPQEIDWAMQGSISLAELRIKVEGGVLDSVRLQGRELGSGSLTPNGEYVYVDHPTIGNAPLSDLIGLNSPTLVTLDVSATSYSEAAVTYIELVLGANVGPMVGCEDAATRGVSFYFDEATSNCIPCNCDPSGTQACEAGRCMCSSRAAGEDCSLLPPHASLDSRNLVRRSHKSLDGLECILSSRRQFLNTVFINELDRVSRNITSACCTFGGEVVADSCGTAWSSWSEAWISCHDQGLRLCTASETNVALNQEFARCGLLWRQFWTDTSCGCEEEMEFHEENTFQYDLSVSEVEEMSCFQCAQACKFDSSCVGYGCSHDRQECVRHTFYPDILAGAPNVYKSTCVKN